MNPLLLMVEESFAQLHDKITNRLILEHLLKYGKVSIEEAKFYKDFSQKILHESSHLLIPSKEEILESIQKLEESEAKILIDPETGEKYIYNMETGELIPAGDDIDVGDEVGDEVPAEDVDLENKEVLADSHIKTESTEIKKELNENEILIEKLLNTLKN